jgi:hypothetical protein
MRLRLTGVIRATMVTEAMATMAMAGPVTAGEPGGRKSGVH